jgi:hypothetical protein
LAVASNYWNPPHCPGPALAPAGKTVESALMMITARPGFGIRYISIILEISLTTDGADVILSS